VYAIGGMLAALLASQGKSMTDETRLLAGFAAGLTLEQVPPRVRTLAIDNLVDQIGCQIGGSKFPWALQVYDTYKASGGVAQATVVRYGDRLPIASAAFINSTFGHAFEYDDANPFFQGHPGVELIPPLMAIAERDHMSGRDFLAAFIAGYEVRGRVGWAVSPFMSERGGPQFSTACGVFGAAAGSARLLGLDAEGIRNAIGIAGSFSGGLMQYDQGGGSVKRIHGAIGASNGLQAACLARAGMTGPEGILEGKRGMLRIYSSEFHPERLAADFGKLWTLEHVLFKPHSCCAIIHPAIEGLGSLMSAHKLAADDIVSVEVGYPKRSYEHSAITNPHDLLGMQFSTSYSLALTAIKGANTPREYTLEALADPNVKAFAAKVTLRKEEELSRRFERRMPARVTVRTKAGGVHENLVSDPKGSLQSPLTSEDIDVKFRGQVGDIIGNAACEKLLLSLRAIERLDDVAKLPALFVSN
jgi:2-methylcitrate dehydratase PrpD